MLFNSIEFLFFFLPAVVIAYYAVARWAGRQASIAVLVGASLFFYGWWNPPFLALLVGSVLVNFYVSSALGRNSNLERRAAILICGIAANLLAIAWFKYSYFVADNLGRLTGAEISLPDIMLPLGISFFTFQQIAYLVDCHQGKVRERSFLGYCLFVTFFPQLIAGPIVHHREMMPQFAKTALAKFKIENLSIGATILAIGLFKKVVLADGISGFATPVFTQAETGQTIDFVTAWVGALSYTFQLYFDFSGYSDMAVGIARLFNIRLPLNFFSPYKATNIIDFWRRWHMTLSRFLKNYLYIPLGGNQLGPVRRYVNLMVVMLLGGLWHGAGWTFVFWGGLHGAFLAINHGWRFTKRRFGLASRVPARGARLASWTLTFLCVVFAWVFFRAESFDGAVVVLRGMLGLGGFVFPPIVGEAVALLGLAERLDLPIDSSLGDMRFLLQGLWVSVLFVIAISLPNTYEWMARTRPTTDFDEAPQARAIAGAWQARIATAVLTGFFFFAVIRNLLDAAPSEFLYFQF